MTGFVDDKQLWANLGNRVSPSVGKIDLGWVAGEQPPHEWENSERFQSQTRLNHCINLLGINGTKPGSLNGPRMCTDTLQDASSLTEADNSWTMGEPVHDACLAWNYEKNMPMLVIIRGVDITANRVMCIDAWEYNSPQSAYYRDIQTAYTTEDYQDAKVCASPTKLYVHYRHSIGTQVARYNLINWTGIPEDEYATGQTTFTEMRLSNFVGDDELLFFKGGGAVTDVLKTLHGLDFTGELNGNGNLNTGGGYSTIDAGVTPIDFDGKIWFASHSTGGSYQLNSAHAYNLGDTGLGPYALDFYEDTWGNIVSTGESTLIGGYASDIMGSNQIVKKWSVGQTVMSAMHEIRNCNQESSIILGFDGVNVYCLYEVDYGLLYNGGTNNRHWSWTRFNAREFAKNTNLTTENDRQRFPSTNLYGDVTNALRSEQWAKMFFDGVNMWIVHKDDSLSTRIFRVSGIRQRQCNVGQGSL